MGFEQLDTVYYILLFFVAALAGFIDSIVGGGGLITLPALIACGVPTHLSLATNKLQSVFGSFTAAARYFRSLSLPGLGWGVAFTALGAAGGSYAVLFVSDENLKLIILIFLVLTFAYTAAKPKLGSSPAPARIRNIKLFHLIFGLILGFYDGFLGPGTGSFWIFVCVIFLGLDMKNASINTKILNFTSNVLALIIFIWQYELLWGLGILMGAGQVAGAYLGTRLVLKTRGTFIKTLLLVVVGATIIKVGWDYFSAS